LSEYLWKSFDYYFSFNFKGDLRSMTHQSVYPLAKIAADFNSATFNSILQNFGEQKFVNFWLKFVD
jgi:hypothetical protein